MNRRHFLQLFAAAATGAVLDPERLLWMPRQMVSVGMDFSDADLLDGYGGNMLVTPEWITREVGRILLSNLQFMYQVNRKYDQQHVIGNTVQIRMPQRWTR